MRRILQKMWLESRKNRRIKFNGNKSDTILEFDIGCGNMKSIREI